MTEYPARVWLALKRLTDSSFYDQLTNLLLEHCLDESHRREVASDLRSAIPKLDKELDTALSEKRKLELSIVINVARSVELEKYCDRKNTNFESDQWLIFEVAFVILISLRNDVMNTRPYCNFKDLLKVYPEFVIVNDVKGEHEKLVDFANFMRCAQLLLPPENNKAHLMLLVTRLTEGKSKRYVCGSRASKSTSNRVLIYTREGGK
jgi:hypothetical protein